MPLQNRVDPFSRLHAVSERGLLMGNRGILHDGARHIRRNHGHSAWIYCLLSFKNRHREVMAPHRYTELFFLDEATALAAGHRPCAECQRARYNQFRQCWAKGDTRPRAPDMDAALHAARLRPDGQKARFTAPVADLPDGAIFVAGEAAVLLWQGRQWDWSFAGYHPRPESVAGKVAVLTPLPALRVLQNGFCPMVHPSADASPT